MDEPTHIGDRSGAVIAAMSDRPAGRHRDDVPGLRPDKKTTPTTWAGVGPDSCRRRQRSCLECQEDRMLDELIELIAEEIAKRS